MNYTPVDLSTYYRRGVYRHFTEDAKCSTSITARVDVTELYAHAKATGSSFYIDFLYLLSKVMNSRDDYRLAYLWPEEQLICFDQVNPTHYVFHEDTETCTPVYTQYTPDYAVFYAACRADIAAAKESRDYGLDMANHPNWFDASYIPWLSYDALHVELPDGYLYFMPIVNWGRFRDEGGRLKMPLSVRLNHAVADGYLVARVFALLETAMAEFAAGDYCK